MDCCLAALIALLLLLLLLLSCLLAALCRPAGEGTGWMYSAALVGLVQQYKARFPNIIQVRVNNLLINHRASHTVRRRKHMRLILCKRHKTPHCLLHQQRRWRRC